MKDPKELYDILACPVCKKELRYDGQRKVLFCDNCKKEYPIIEGIPILLPE